ncbi:MAG TPA: outer membrane protein [Xanthobacteraceae bacterium]|jgi:outer membrane immunogenic protein
MKRIARAAALLVTIAAGAAAAADLPRSSYYTAPAPLSTYSWTGPYLGGNLGYEWGATSNNPTRPSGFAGGVQGGYNWQSGQLVLGGEADLQISGANDTFAPWKFSNPWFGTVRGRAGYAVNNILIYGTAGIALGELQAQSFGLVSENHTNVGWTAGAGVEAGFAPNWSAKVEYLFVDLASNTYALTGTSNGLSASLFRMGVNYHF